MQDPNKLRVYPRARETTRLVFAATRTITQPAARPIVAQLRRAVQSIAANIAEGAGKDSSAHFANFLNNAIGSANECFTHLDDLRDLDFMTPASHAQLAEPLNHVRAMLLNLHRRVSTPPPQKEKGTLGRSAPPHTRPT